jgi:hypothetical protein
MDSPEKSPLLDALAKVGPSKLLMKRDEIQLALEIRWLSVLEHAWRMGRK